MARKDVDYKALTDTVCTTGKEFSEAMQGLFRVAVVDIDQVVRALVLKMSSRMIKRTPFDTGRARAGYSIDQLPTEWVPPPGQYAPEEVKQAIEKTLAELPPQSKITLSNNIEYLLPLEAGHSSKVPYGFLALTLQEMRVALDAEADMWSKKSV